MLTWIVDRRASLSPTGDQGDRLTCLSWALTAAHEFTVSDGPFSVEYLHWNSGHYPGGRGTVLAAARALRSEGQPGEVQWPYLDRNDDADPAYAPPSMLTGPFCKAVVRLSRVDVDTLIADLGSDRLPVVALRVTDALLAARGGVVGEDGPGSDGHAVAVVGVAQYLGTKDLGSVRPNDRLVCVRNSWGSGWGVDGYALMTEAALTACALGSFVIDPVQPSSGVNKNIHP
jgi:hypothetical protein